MTSLAMFLSFIMLIVGGYGFSSTKVASLNIPLMQKIAPTVHSWAFLNPLFCGLVLFAYAVFSASKRHSFQALQAVVGIMLVLVIANGASLFVAISSFANGQRPSLEVLLVAESGLCALIYGTLAGVRLVKTTAQRKPLVQGGVDSSEH